MSAKYFCAVYYLKATFGPSTCDAVLEMPVSVTADRRCFSFAFQISSSKVQLVVSAADSGSSEFSSVASLSYTDQEYIGLWNYPEYDVTLDSGVDRIRFEARKTGVTTSVEYVLVDVVGIESCFEHGKYMTFLPYKVLGEFPLQPFYLSHKPFGNCLCLTSVLPFSVTVRYGRAT